MKRIISLTVCGLLLFSFLTGCGDKTSAPGKEPADSAVTETVDYAARLTLDMTTESVKQEVTVKTFVDGDTTHFFVPQEVMHSGVLKARFMAVNTPESTGKIEEFGKAASNFTKEKLSQATSIIVESDTEQWNADSTGDRYLVWVWYKTADMTDYRNLNVELLQNGLAIANSSANNRYGDVCLSAIDQAKNAKLYVYSGQKDPDFYYGEAVELTLKELRTNVEQYSGMKVAFNGIISANSGTQGVYVEDYDAETDLYYGMYIYYGHSLSGPGLDALTVGNEARIVGTVQYYEGGGTWQVSDLTYRLMKPDDPGNVQKLSSGNAASYRLTEAKRFAEDTVTLENGETVAYAAACMGTSVRMEGLKVTDIYTTTSEESSSKGAMTMICQADGVTVTVRTAVLVDANGTLITQDAYDGKTISVNAIVDYFDGAYQLKVFSADNITIDN